MRQQAVGNIYHTFYSGKKALFYKNSLNYKYFKNFGYKIFSIEDDLTQDILSQPLSEEIQKYNYSLASSNEDYKTYINKLQVFFDKLSKEGC